ncbi:MAG: hypothetical protein ACTSPX_01265 [Candidatus Thorarchaeota archaeon]
MGRGAPDGYAWSAPTALRGVGGSNLYTGSLTIPANTNSGSPVSQDVELCDGWVAQIDLLFPPGPATLAHVQVWVDGSLKYPTGAGQSFNPDNILLTIPCDFDVPEVAGTHQITLKGWNEDDTWDHTILYWVWVIPY